MKLKLILILLTTTLVGCANPMKSALEEQQRIKDTWAARFEGEPLIMKLKDKVWLTEINDAPLRYFTNKDYAADSDKPGLEKIDQVSKQNFQELEAFARKYTPQHLPILEPLRAANFSLFLRLYEKKISYGEYHSLRKDLVAKQREAIAERDRELMYRVEDAQSRATANFINFLMAQQLIDALRQPTYVNQPNVNYQIYAPPPVNIRPPAMPGVIR